MVQSKSGNRFRSRLHAPYHFRCKICPKSVETPKIGLYAIFYIFEIVMREFNKKIEDALGLLSQKKVKEASELLSALVECEDKKELANFIEAVLGENVKERAETRESLKTFMSSISWRVSQGFGYR